MSSSVSFFVPDALAARGAVSHSESIAFDGMLRRYSEEGGNVFSKFRYPVFFLLLVYVPYF